MTEPANDRALEDALRALETPTLPAADRAAIRAAIRTAGTQQDGTLRPPPPATGLQRSWQIVVGLAGLALTGAAWQMGRTPQPIVDAPPGPRIAVAATYVVRTTGVAPRIALADAPRKPSSDSTSDSTSNPPPPTRDARPAAAARPPAAGRPSSDVGPATDVGPPFVVGSSTAVGPPTIVGPPTGVRSPADDPPSSHVRPTRDAPSRPTATPGPVLPHTPAAAAGDAPTSSPTVDAATASPTPAPPPITGIAGTVRLDGAPFAFAAVRAVPADGGEGRFVVGSTDSDGAYLLRLAPGAWRVAAEGDGWPARWWPGAARVEEAAVVVVIAGAVTGGIDFELR